MAIRNAIPRNEREAQARERSLAALALMRREGLTLTAAARSEEVDPRTVRRYVGSTIRQKGPGGRYRAAAYDRIPRRLNMLTPRGTVPVIVRDSRTASRIGEYMNAVRVYVTNGDTSALAQFKGKSFQASGEIHLFVADPSVLDRLAEAGTPAIDTLYRTQAGRAG